MSVPAVADGLYMPGRNSLLLEFVTAGCDPDFRFDRRESAGQFRDRGWLPNGLLSRDLSQSEALGEMFPRAIMAIRIPGTPELPPIHVTKF